MPEPEIFVVFHGHFYQPPRENPWLGRIERQPSARPYHDWNQRIAAECYTPNTVSRILDHAGMIDDIVNNFGYYNFNIGPTLMSWLETNLPSTYRRIIEADAASIEARGHGNAIAQVYSHLIMPLSCPEDRAMQIEWGLREFRHRFGRNSEGMWLAETACNLATVRDLIDAGVRYTVLSPNQALRCRPFGEDEWTDVSGGNVDTGRAFRVYDIDADGNKIDGRYLDVIFFNESLSRAVSFEHLLRSGDRLAETIRNAANPHADCQLINIATDGETFGHHQSFGDMCMAYFFTVAAPRMGFKVTNYGAFLDEHPPTWEVELKSGHEGLGTAWSCAHGVDRWHRDCGCSTGGLPGWNQKWRKPLREGLNRLRDKIVRLYEREAAKITADPGAAWRDYIGVVLDRHRANVADYCSRHTKGWVDEAEHATLLALMEMRLNAMLMFTSCGWFFTDISGIETVQNLKYAARAIDIARRLTGEDYEPTLLRELNKARSNIDHLGTGRDIYLRWVKPAAFGPERVVASFAIEKLLRNHNTRATVGPYDVQELDTREMPDRYASRTGLVNLTDTLTWSGGMYAYYVTHFTAIDTRCYVKRIDERPQYDKLLDALETSQKFSIPDIFGSQFYNWHHLVPEAAESIMASQMEHYLGDLRETFRKRFDKDRELYEAYVNFGMTLPVELRPVVSASLSAELTSEVMKMRGNWTDAQPGRAEAVIAEGRRFEVDLDTEDIVHLVQEDLLALAHQVKNEPRAEAFENLTKIMRIAESLGLDVRKDMVENILIELYDTQLLPAARALADPEQDIDDYYRIMDVVHYMELLNFSARRVKEAMAGFEKKLQKRPPQHGGNE